MLRWCWQYSHDLNDVDILTDVHRLPEFMVGFIEEHKTLALEYLAQKRGGDGKTCAVYELAWYISHFLGCYVRDKKFAIFDISKIPEVDGYQPQSWGEYNKLTKRGFHDVSKIP
jgi:hypothetical protein